MFDENSMFRQPIVMCLLICYDFCRRCLLLIVKKNGFPIRLVGLMALSRRLHDEDVLKKRVEEVVRIVRAGVNGEKTLATVFEKYTFRDPHFIFHDLNLKSTGLFQIDTLFLSQHGATILEVKNIAGEIYFPPEQNQMIRTLSNGQVDAFECPSVQLVRNKLLLKDWFQSNGFDMPIQTAVVFSNPRQHFKNMRDQLKVLFPLEVPVYLRELMETPHFLEIPSMTDAANMLCTAHHEYNPFPLCEKYPFEPDQIKKGVHCMQCGLHEMIPVSTGWACLSCNHFSKDAHQCAIMEYFMLFGGQLTNRMCREFLGLTSSDKAKRLMKQMNLPFRGMKRGRSYYLPLKKLENKMQFLYKQ